MPFADVARQYAALFDDTPYEVITVFLTGKKDQQIAEQVGSNVIFLENTSKDIRGLKRKQIRQLKDICKQYNFRFAIAHRFKPIFIASHIKDLPIIGVHHAFGDYSRWSRRWHARRHAQQINLVANSNSVRDDIRGDLTAYAPEKIQTLYNRIDEKVMAAQLVSREEARKTLNLDENAFIFANVGRLHPDKDQSTLLKAFAACYQDIPNSLLVIIGQGRLQAALEAEANQLGISDRVKFPGKVPDAYRYFRGFDCFTLSSDHEPFGMVLLEAMVAGIPMIATDCGGAPEVVGDTGYLVPLGDFQAMADKMLQVSRLSTAEQGKLKELMLQRLVSHFSDQAVHKSFWELPFMQPFKY